MKPLIALAAIAALSASAAAEVEFLNMPLPAPYTGALPPDAMDAQQRESEQRALTAHLERRIARLLHEQKVRAAIERAEAEVQALDRQIAQYESISRPRFSHPFLLSLETVRLARLEAVQRLELLRTERQLFNENFHTLRRLEQLR